MKKVLITGGAGFIGSNFANHNQEKYEIVVLDNFFLGSKDNLNSSIQLIEGDAALPADLERCGSNFDIVIHLAGTSSAPMFMGESLVSAYLNSVASFLQTLEFARKCGAKKFLYASTSSLYGNTPGALKENAQVQTTNHYAVSKHFYEECSECYQRVFPELDIVGFRFMSVYGPNEEAKGRYANLISQFIWDYARGKRPVVYGDGTQTRDFTNVKDIVQALTLAIEHPEPLGWEIFNIGTGQGESVNEMLRLVAKYLKTDLTPRYIENPVKENYVMTQHADISKIVSVLGYKPEVDLETGIKNQVANLRPEKIKETSSDFFS
jgi:UDP-glucose 4-epimerase